MTNEEYRAHEGCGAGRGTGAERGGVMIDSVELGIRLKKLRIDNSETQLDVANLLHKSKARICQIEKGKCGPTMYEISQLARHYGVSMEFIVNGNVGKKEVQ